MTAIYFIKIHKTIAHGENYFHLVIFALHFAEVLAYQNSKHTGLVTLRFRSINTFTQPFVQRPRDFRPPAMNGGGASYRIRVWMPLSMQEGFQIAWNKGSVQSCVRPVYAAFIRCWRV